MRINALIDLLSYLPHLVICCLLAISCGNSGTPLDAETRHLIDSLSGDQIKQARIELDSFCVIKRTTELPVMIDSIKRKRLQEIEQQLKSVPR